MEKLWNAFEVFITLFEAFLIMFFICSFFKFRLCTFKRRCIYVLASLVFAAIVTFINNLTTFEAYIGIIYSVYIFLFSLIICKGNIVLKAFISLLTNICLISISTFASSVISLIFGDNYTQTYSDHQSLPRFLLVIIVQALLAASFYLLVKFFGKGKIKLERKDWFIVFLMFSITFATIAGIHLTLLNCRLSKLFTVLLTLSEVGLIIINCICIHIISELNKANKLSLELAIQKKQYELSTQYAENIQFQYNETRRAVHDIKQHFTVLEYLMENEQMQSALDYIKSNKNNFFPTATIVNVGNDFVTAILNSKLSLAKEKSIKTFITSTRDFSGIDPFDLCSLLGNMLDNAIEASEKCPSNKRYIEITITSSDTKLTILISNSVAEAILESNKTLETTKANPDEHGFGVKTINKIAKKYSGIVKNYGSHNTFNSKVILYREEVLT